MTKCSAHAGADEANLKIGNVLGSITVAQNGPGRNQAHGVQLAARAPFLSAVPLLTRSEDARPSRTA
jgi:hypothetical protein